jgi:hypothetical protein
MPMQCYIYLWSAIDSYGALLLLLLQYCLLQKGFSAGNYKSFICYKQYIYTPTNIHTYIQTQIKIL